MNQEVPNVSMTGHYNIKRTSDELGLHRNTLRSIPSSLLPVHYHKATGRKFYLGKEILKYWSQESR